MKYLKIIVLIVLIAGATFFGLKWNKSHKVFTPDTGATTETKEVRVQDQIFDTPTPYATFDVVYPQFTNVSADFNNKIKEFAMERIAEHTKTSEQDWKARAETDRTGQKGGLPTKEEKYPFHMNYEISQLNQAHISFLLRFDGYEGGAHGYANSEAYNYDIKTAHELQLKDFFPNDPNYLVTISKYTRAKLTEKFKEDAIKNGSTEANWKDTFSEQMLNDGTEPNIDNFKTVTFNDDELIFHFKEYQVGPYVLGEQEVTMPRAM